MEREPANHDVRFGSGDDGRERAVAANQPHRKLLIIVAVRSAVWHDRFHSFIRPRARARTPGMERYGRKWLMSIRRIFGKPCDQPSQLY